MPNVNQTYAIVNAIGKQTWGETAIQVVDTSSMIALGDKVLSSDTDRDVWTKTLMDRIGKTVFSDRRYSARYPGVVKHSFEYGCIVQKIYVDMPDAVENKKWDISDPEYVPKFAPVFKTDVKQKLFDKISTWEIDVTIPDNLLKTAFTNATTMAVFISAIYTAIDNRMEIALENCVELTRASFIARKLKGAKPCGAINLLTKYNTVTGQKLTASTCLLDLNFLKWSTMMISMWTKRMARMSQLFNEENYKRHTPREELVLTVLDDFDSATRTFLQADTYHKELVSLPYYDTVPYWQGSGTDYEFASTSAIDINLGDSVVKKGGILAIAYDYQALGVTMNDRRTTSERNDHDEYTNYYNKANMGYFNDMSENGIVFYIEDAPGK